MTGVAGPSRAHRPPPGPPRGGAPYGWERPRPGAVDPVTVPIPRPRVPDRRDEPTRASPAARRPLVAAVVVVLVLAVVGGGVALAARAGAAQPCAASAGSSLPGFDDVVGPRALPAVPKYAALGAQVCMYTPDAGPVPVPGTTGSMLMLTRIPRPAVDADPELSGYREQETPSSTSSSYPMELVDSGVTMIVEPGSGDDASDASTVRCATTDDYWSIIVGSTGRDDSDALDALLVDLGCRPLTS